MHNFNMSFFEMGQDIIPLLNQADVNSDTTSDWIKMRDYTRALVVIAKYGSEQIDTVDFAFQQATSNGGTGKALNVSRYWTKAGTLTSATVWTAGVLATPIDKLAVGSSVPTGSTRVLADATTLPFILAVDFTASDFDSDNAYNWFSVFVDGTQVDNACLISAWIILMNGRYPQLTPLSAIS